MADERPRRDDDTRLVRHGLWVYVFIASASIAADVLGGRSHAFALGAYRAIGVVVAVAGARILARWPALAVGRWVITGTFAVIVAAALAQDAISRDPYGTQLMVAMVSLTIGAFMPWDWRDQLKLAGVGIAGVAVHTLIVGGPPFLAINTALGCLASVGVAFALQRERAAAAESRARATASEARLRQIAEHAREVFWTLDLRDAQLPELSYVSPGAQVLMGLAPGAAGLPALLARVHPDDRGRLRELFAMAGQARGPGAVEFRIVTTRDEVRHVQARFTPIRDDAGALVRLGGVLEDVTTERLAAAALEQARDEAQATARLRTQFLAAMSHEISTPLTAILGTLELLRDESASTVQRRRWQTIHTGAQALHLVLSDVLDFTKSEAGALRLQPVELDLGELVAGIVELHAARARARGLDLRFAWQGPPLLTAVGDAGRLRQVLNNLVSNALKFTPAGEVVVQAAASGAPPGEIRFTVSDTGIGVDADARQRIFQPFTQGDASIAPRYGGSGLGLAIAARLVRTMGGAIGVDSDARGSSFWFTLPVGEPSAEAPPPDGIAGRRLLVVSADRAFAAPVLAQLERWRASGADIDDPAAVWRELQRASGDARPYDAIVLILGAGEAAAMTRWLLDVGADAAAVPTMVLAAGGRGSDAVAAAEAGAAAWVAAPLRPGTLGERLAACWRPATLQAAGGGPPLARGHVLVVDDSEIIREVTAELLQSIGQDVTAVAGGAQALAALGAQRFDLVMLDCQMPEMDGFETARRIRAAEPASAPRTPIIAFSAGAPELHRERCLAAGMDDCLAKPMALPALRELIARWVAPTAARAGTPDAFDRERLADLAGADAAAVRRYCELFLREARELIRAVGNAADGDPPAELPERLHRARGAAAYVGAASFERSLARVARADTGVVDLEALARELTLSLDAFERAVRALEQELGAAAPGDHARP